MFTDEDIINIFVGDGIYLMLTKSAMEHIGTLSDGGKNLFIHLYKNMRIDETLFYFNKWEYMTKFRIKSVKKIDAYIKELESACIMRKSDTTNWYWANPNYLYRGSGKRLLGKVLNAIINQQTIG